MKEERIYPMQPEAGTNGSAAEEAMESLRRELRISRIFNGIVSLLLVCLIAGGVFVGVKVQKFAAEVQPIAEKLAEVDVDALNDTMENLNDTMKEVDWEQLSQQLSKLDMEALNEAIDGLDTKALSDTLEKLNQAAEVLESFSDSMKSFFSKFSFVK